MALMQFLRLRRGVSEVVYTIDFKGDVSAVLAEGARLVRRGRWPARADGLRAIDQCGRTLMRWEIAVDTDQPSAALLATASKRGTAGEPRLPLPARDYLPGGVLPDRLHHFDVGQPVSYADDVEPDIWKGGYEIIELPIPADHEPQYVIRNAHDTYNLVVQEHELREDLGARLRGR
jgi:hypothetical protein